MKKYDVYLMPDAIKDIEAIYSYIVEQSGFPERAWSYIVKLRLECLKLKTAPLRGQLRDDLMASLRSRLLIERQLLLLSWMKRSARSSF